MTLEGEGNLAITSPFTTQHMNCCSLIAIGSSPKDTSHKCNNHSQQLLHLTGEKLPQHSYFSEQHLFESNRAATTRIDLITLSRRESRVAEKRRKESSRNQYRLSLKLYQKISPTTNVILKYDMLEINNVRQLGIVQKCRDGFYDFDSPSLLKMTLTPPPSVSLKF